MDELRQKVISSNKSVPYLYQNTVSQIKDSGLPLVVGALPDFKNEKSKLYRARNKAEGVKKLNYKCIHEVEIPKKFKDFLLVEHHDKSNRILVFCSLDKIELLGIIKHVFLDGTFRSCPTPFCELYVILGDIGSTDVQTNIVPLMYALLTKRNKENYKKLFQIIKSKVPHFNPTKFTLDFEQAAMAAIRDIFPTAQIKGCYFHFSQAVWKKGKEFNLTKCQETRKTVAHSALLPLIPKYKISDAWEYISIESKIATEEKSKELKEFLGYMAQQWLRSEEWIGVWCVSNELHRTNNATEAWNGRLNKIIGKKKPTLAALLLALKKDSESVLKTGECTQKLPKYISRNRWIAYVLEQLENGTINIGHCLEKLRK